MSINFNQNNNNYGSGTQNNIQKVYDSNIKPELFELLEELKRNKSECPQEVEHHVDELVQTIENTSENDFSKPNFVSKVSSLFTSLSTFAGGALTLSGKAEELFSTIERIKTIFVGFWQ